jgi:hypothetical protein
VSFAISGGKRGIEALLERFNSFRSINKVCRKQALVRAWEEFHSQKVESCTELAENAPRAEFASGDPRSRAKKGIFDLVLILFSFHA